VTPEPLYRLAWNCSVVGHGGTVLVGYGSTAPEAAADLRRQLDEQVEQASAARNGLIAAVQLMRAVVDE
jgi:hypothetical protein